MSPGSNFSGTSDPELIVEEMLAQALMWEHDGLARLEGEIARMETNLAKLRLERMQSQVRVQVLQAEIEAHKAHR